MTARLFEPLALRGLALRNRVVVSPMCMYSAEDGMADDFHLVQAGRYALGGAGLVFVEATAVQPEGRITHGDLGLWSQAQVAPLARIAAFLKSQGAAAGIQLGHAGRKASMQRPWFGNGPLGADDAARGDLPWPIAAPSARPVADGWLVPAAMDAADIARLLEDFGAAARRACRAGFDVVELHCAHGYLLHTFLSPLTNLRTDDWGGDRERRMRLPLAAARALRENWPADRPVFVRVSAVDHEPGGITIDDTVELARALRAIGIDVIDCSSGGAGGSPTAGFAPRAYGFQVPYAARVRSEAGIATMAVGLVVDPHQAESVVAHGHADLVAIARGALADPNWPLHARAALGADAPQARYDAWPRQAGWWLHRRQAVIDRLGPYPGDSGDSVDPSDTTRGSA